LETFNIKEIAYSATDSVVVWGLLIRFIPLLRRNSPSSHENEEVVRQIAFRFVTFSINSFGNFQEIISGAIAIIFSFEF
jgi:hypothetical protein